MIVGSAHVEIHVITDAVQAEIRSGLERAMAGQGGTAGKQFSDDFNRESGRNLGGSVRRSLDRVVRDTTRSGDDAGKGFFGRLSERLRRPILAQVGIDPGAIKSAITNVAALVNALQVVALPAAAAAILPYLISLAADATTAAGALWLLPAGMLAGAAAVGTLIIGFKGLGKALGPRGTKEQIDKANEALAKLPPNARAAVSAILGLSGAWHDLHSAVQNNLFAGMSKDISALGGTYLPILQTQLGRIATAYNVAARATIGVLLSRQSIDDTNTGLNNLNSFMGSAARAAAPLTQAFRDIAVVGSSFFPAWGEGFAGMAQRFADFIARARESGQLRIWIQNALDVFSQLGRILQNVGSMFHAMFTAISTTGRSTLDILEAITGNLATKWNTPAGLAGLTKVFGDIRAVVGFLADKFIQLWPAIAAAAGAIAALLASVAPLSGVITPLVVSALVPLLHVITNLAPVLGPLIVLTYSAITAYKLLYGAFIIVRSAIIGYQIAQAILTGGTIANTVALEINKAAVIAGQVAAIAVRGAVIAWTAAQWALNVALDANPIGLIVIAIAALIAAVVAIGYGIYKLVTNWTTVWTTIKDATLAVVAWFQGPFLDFFKGLPAFFSNLWSNVTEFFTRAWDTISTGVGDAFDAVVGFFSNLPGRVVGALQGLGSAIAGAATAAWNWLVTSAQTAGRNVLDFVTGLPNRIAYALGYLVGTLARLGIDAWDAFTNAITTAWNATYAWVTALPGRFMAALANLGNSLATFATNAWNGFTSGIVNAWNATYAWVTALPGRFMAGLANLGTTLLNFATDAWNGFTSGITNAWSATWAWIRALPGRIVVGLAGLGVMLMNAAVDGWNGFTTGIQNAWNATVSWFQSLPDRIGNFFTGLGGQFTTIATNAWNGFTSGLTSAWNATLSWFQGIPGQIKSALAGAGQWLLSVGGDIIHGLWNGIQNTWNSFWGWITGLWDSFIQGVKDAMGIHSPSTVFADIGVQILQGLWDGLKSMVGGIMGFFRDLWNNIISFFQTIWTSISNIATNAWNSVAGFFKGAFNAFLDFFRRTWTAVVDFFVQRWQNLQANATSIWNAISSFFTNAFNSFTSFFRNVWQAILDFFVQRWRTLQANAIAIWTAISSFFTNAFNSFTSFFRNVWQNILNFFTATWNNLRNTGTNIWNSINNFFRGAFSTFTGFFSNTWTNIKNVFSNLWTNIKNVASTVWGQINSFFHSAFGAFTSYFVGVWNGIRDAFSNAFGGIKAIASRIWTDVKNIFSGAINLVIKVPNWITGKINSIFGTHIATIAPFHFAQGGTPGTDAQGRVRGQGGQRQDRVPALLSPEEHVWSAQEVRGVGGHQGVRRLREMARSRLLEGFADGGFLSPSGMLPKGLKPGAYVVPPEIAQMAPNFLDALSKGQAEAVQATGGRYARLAAGGNVEQALGVARRLQGTPYVWGGTSPHGVDCSGLQSVVTNTLRGVSNPWSRVGTTATFPWSGFKSGKGTYTIGNSRSKGHMAGTLAGNNMESGSGHGAMVGGRALGATSRMFDFQGYLPEVGGVFTPGAGADAGINYGALFDSMAGWVKKAAHGVVNSVVPANPPPEFFRGMANSVIDQAWNGVRTTAVSAMSSVGNGIINFVTGGGADKDMVKAAAAQRGWGAGPEWSALDWIINHESGWNAGAQNGSSTASGLFQFIDSTWRAYRGGAGSQYAHMKNAPVGIQAQAGMAYIGSRYGDPLGAQSFWQGHHWYDSGGLLQPGITVAHNNTGKAEVIGPVDMFRDAMMDVFRRMAPELAFSIEAGNKAQMDYFANQIIRNQPRAAAIQDAIAGVFDKYMPNLGNNVDALGDKVAATNRAMMQSFLSRVQNVAPTHTTTVAQRTQIKWGDTLGELAKRFGTTVNTLMSLNPQIKDPNRIYAGNYLNLPAKQIGESTSVAMSRVAKTLLAQMPATVSAQFAKSFPDVMAAINTSAPNLQQLLSQRASAILAQFGSSTTAVNQLVSTIENGPTTTQQLEQIGSAIIGPKGSTPPPSVTFQNGAFSVVIQGNADAVTVDQLRAVLNGWSQQIVREYESRS